MARRSISIMVLAATTLVAALANTPGTFTGAVVEPPVGAVVDDRWIYVLGRNRALRRVEISAATIFFADEVPQAMRPATARQALQQGAEVRVTARLDDAGEWRAVRVEITRLAPPRRSKRSPSSAGAAVLVEGG